MVTTSYPYLLLSRQLGVQYADVLNVADYIENNIEHSRSNMTYWQRLSYCRLGGSHFGRVQAVVLREHKRRGEQP